MGNLLAACTGLRAGEILALRVQDIGEDRLFIRHSFSEAAKIDGYLKDTKTHEERSVPLPSSLREELFNLVKQSPHGDGPESFIFFSVSMADRPMDNHFLRDPLHEMLIILSVGEKASPEDRKKAREGWKQRNIVFHSWRHFYAARMAGALDARKVMTATGHKTEALFEWYAAHATEETFREVSETTNQVFENILEFKREA